MKLDESAAHKVKEIRGWATEILLRELRNPGRATLGPDAYHLLFAEALARLLERKMLDEKGK